MTAREKIQLGYELAFFPPALNKLWGGLRHHPVLENAAVGEALDMAALLHLTLPESGYASQRALQRLALYQAQSRAFGMPAFVRAVRARLGRPTLNANSVPGALVRDIALPVFGRVSATCPTSQSNAVPFVTPVRDVVPPQRDSRP
jgi:hypothetical protein